MDLTPPIPNAYWVIPGQFLAGPYPGGYPEEAARQRLGLLLEGGFTYFLDLTRADESWLDPYAGLLADEAARRGRQVFRNSQPIQDFDIPAPQQMDRILNDLETALLAGHKVYLHCYGGIGRTGTVVGCYLRRQGLGGQAALQQISTWRQDLPSGRCASPETEAQRQMILDWNGGSL